MIRFVLAFSLLFHLFSKMVAESTTRLSWQQFHYSQLGSKPVYAWSSRPCHCYSTYKDRALSRLASPSPCTWKHANEPSLDREMKASWRGRPIPPSSKLQHCLDAICVPSDEATPIEREASSFGVPGLLSSRTSRHLENLLSCHRDECCQRSHRWITKFGQPSWHPNDFPSILHCCTSTLLDVRPTRDHRRSLSSRGGRCQSKLVVCCSLSSFCEFFSLLFQSTRRNRETSSPTPISTGT